MLFTILVLNPRQPLSGNKLTYYLLFTLLVVVQGCFLFKPAADEPIADQPDEPIDTPDVAVVDTLIDTTDVPVIDRQPSFEIAVLLPFSIDEKFIDSFDFERRSIAYRPRIAVEMYEGMLLALQDLDTLGIDLTLHVYDTKNKMSEIEFLVALQEMANVDMILGPLFPDNFRRVARTARKKNIWIVAPYVCYSCMDTTYNRYLHFTPTLWAHHRAMAGFLAKQDSTDQILIIHSASDADRHHARNLLGHLEEYSPFTELPPGVLLEAKANGVYDSTYLSKDAPNWVVVTSFNEVFINNTLRLLGNQVKRYPIHLMGMPTWLDNYESLRLDYLNDLDYHFTEGIVMDTGSVFYKHVDSTYRAQYGYRPSENTLRGYELLYTHVMMLMQEQLPPNLFDPAVQQRISHGIQYIGQTQQQDRPGPDEIEMFVNGKVHIFRYKDWRIERVE